MVNFLEQECKDIIELSLTFKGSRRDKNSSIDPRPVEGIMFNYWRIPNNSENKWIFDRFNLYVEKNTNHKVINSLEYINLHRYSVGDRFTKHKDIYYPGQIFNVGCSLNSDYIGGEFKLYSPDIIVGEAPGELYLFENNRYHEVTEVLDGERWSLIGFYKVDNLNFKGRLL